MSEQDDFWSPSGHPDFQIVPRIIWHLQPITSTVLCAQPNFNRTQFTMWPSKTGWHRGATERDEMNRVVSVVSCPMCSTSHLPMGDNLQNGAYACTCEKCGHFFKFRAVGDVKDSISLTINGESYNVGNEHNPATSLLEFMRKTGISKGTKGCCYEGGCGVCLVTLKTLDPFTGNQRLYTVNSCCLQLYTCDGMEITTVEGLGSTVKGLHPIQERLSDYNGSQCGYCTPGQVMNMYGLLQSNPKPTMKEVEEAYDATICRCTGYRPILDAMKSFAVDASPNLKGGLIDIEELDGKLCKKSGKACTGHCSSQNGMPRSTCNNSIEKPVHIVTDRAQWLKPLTLADLYPLLKQYANERYRLVFGNTGFGVYGEVGPWNFSVLIDLRGVKELYVVDTSPGSSITLGANISLNNLREFLEKSTDPDLPYNQIFADHIKLTASNSVRNLGSWAGNLMLKRLHPEFPSDVFTMLETVGAKITIANSDGVSTQCSLPDFLSVDMKAKVIVSLQLPRFNDPGLAVRTFKTSHRLQNSHAHVTSGFSFSVDASSDYLVKSKPSIIIQGINKSLIHAIQTEAYLNNKKLGDPAVLKTALNTLAGELVPDSTDIWASPTYRKSLALGHFYKFVLSVCKTKCSSSFASGGPGLDRPLMTATHDYGTQNPKTFPVSKDVMKTTIHSLTTGQAPYVGDVLIRQGQLFAAPVLSTQGNAKIQSIDSSGALQIPGVVKFIQASDIPGQNNWRPKGYYQGGIEELLASSQVLFAGQPVGILVAEDEVTATSARYGVKVNYTDIQPPILSVEDAIQKKSFFPVLGPYTKGDAKAAMAAAPHRITGNVSSPAQYNFFLENQVAFCEPNGTGGMDVQSASQWLDATVETVAQVLGIPQSDVTVETQRLGGGFGGKIFYCMPVAGMCAVASQITQRPVMLNMDLHTNMRFQGKRTRYLYQYEIGFDDDGKILAIDATAYSDTGALFFDQDGNEYTQIWLDSAYYCPNWSWTVQPCKTNKPLATAVRAPGSAPAIFAMESMLDHVATYLKKDHLAVRKINLFKNGEESLSGVVMEHCLISQVVNQLDADIKYADRIKAVNDFNKANRWKKRGLHIMPSRYAMLWNHFIHRTSVFIHHGDGSVGIAHGGIDIGQGINTKVIQACAYKLGIPMDKIKVKKSSTTVNFQSNWTAGSVISELISMSVMKCCDTLLKRMEPSKAKLVNPTWEQIVTQAFKDKVDLGVQILNDPVSKYPNAQYSVWSACCTEVELDVLTGQYQLTQVDFLYDCGISLNPELDLGQIEGGFVMGCGLFLLEDMHFDLTSGKALTDGTWEYKPPLGKDLPIKFNVKFLRNAPNPVGVLGSKGTGEVPLTLGACPLFALKRAVEAARADVGTQGWFEFSAPATVERIHSSCLNDVNSYNFGN